MRRFQKAAKYKETLESGVREENGSFFLFQVQTTYQLHPGKGWRKIDSHHAKLPVPDTLMAKSMAGQKPRLTTRML